MHRRSDMQRMKKKKTYIPNHTSYGTHICCVFYVGDMRSRFGIDAKRGKRKTGGDNGDSMCEHNQSEHSLNGWQIGYNEKPTIEPAIARLMRITHI